MLAMRGARALIAALVLGLLTTASLRAQQSFSPIRKIKLPVPALRGIWWSAAVQSRWLFSVRLTPDNDLLVFQPNKDGKWPLVRAKRWWTTSPESTILNIPAWSGADAGSLASLWTDLQVTSDGRYALAFAAAQWHKADKGVGRELDVIITLVDLDRWQIAGSFHALDLGLATGEGGRIFGNDPLVLIGSSWDPSKSLSTTVYKVVSLPALQPGAACTVEVPFTAASGAKRDEQDREKSNDAACAEVLKASRTGSVRDLESLTRTGARATPQSLRRLDAPTHFWFEPSDGNWYGLDSVHSQLSVWNFQGEILKKQPSPSLLCENQPVQGPAWMCDCQIVGLLGSHHLLLTYCLTKHDNFFGLQDWLRQWISLFRSDDLSEVGTIRLSRRNEETKELLAVVEKRAYVLTVSLGDTLRIFEIPDR